jgi:uncharacterized protein (TIGR02246 family)
MALGSDDLVAIRRTADLYAVAVDRGDAMLFADQFTPDGILVAPRGRFETRDALAGVPAMMKERYERTFHAVLTQAVDGAGDRASGETYCIARHWFTDGAGKRTCFEMTIRYQDRFERRDGRWLIATRELVVDATHRYLVDMPKTA